LRMAVQYKPAPEVEEVARELIPEYHAHLAEAKIEYLYRVGTWNSKGKVMMAKIHVLSGREKHLTGLDIVMEVNRAVWGELDAQQREALIDHKLCHVVEGKDGYKRVDHDLGEFSAVIRRHGLWNHEVQGFVKAVRQMTFNEIEAPPEQPAGKGKKKGEAA